MLSRFPRLVANFTTTAQIQTDTVCRPELTAHGGYLSRARGRGLRWVGNGSRHLPGVFRCILVRGAGYGDVLVGSRVMVLRYPQNAPVQGDFADFGRV